MSNPDSDMSNPDPDMLNPDKPSEKPIIEQSGVKLLFNKIINLITEDETRLHSKLDTYVNLRSNLKYEPEDIKVVAAIFDIDKNNQPALLSESENFKSPTPTTLITPTTFINAEVYKNLDFFDIVEEGQMTVIDAIGPTKTIFGRAILEHILRNPVCSTEIIKQRQKILQNNYDNGLFNICETDDFKINNDILYYWKQNHKNDISSILYEFIYYQIPLIKDYLNKNELLLLLSNIYKIFCNPVITILTPLLSFLVPYFLFKQAGINMSFSTIFKLMKSSVFSVSFLPTKIKSIAILSVLIWLSLYLYGVYSACQSAYLTNKMINIIHTKLKTAYNIINISRQIINKSAKYPDFIREQLCISDCNLDTEVLLYSDTIQSDPCLINNKGKILAIYWQLNNHLDDLKKRLKMISYVDAYNTISKYLKYIDQSKLKWCYADFSLSSGLNLNSNNNIAKTQIKSIWHPVLYPYGSDKPKEPTTNNLKLKNKKTTLILTGPNAGGKSTFVKTLIINAIFTQTFGISFSKKWVVKQPFVYIDTFFSVPDVEGHTSLFEAEMNKCKSLLKNMDLLKYQKQKHPELNISSLIGLDEIFSSTNYKEGYSATYSIIKYISTNIPDLLCLLTTHFTELTKLQKEIPDYISNYYFDIIKNEQNKIIGYTFKLKRGINSSFVAIDILEKNGYSEQILNDARTVYKTL